MEFIGIDVHKRESQVCILAAEGTVVEKRIRTERGRFAELLCGRARARILIEASTESEWVARCLEGLGHEVVVADPNFSPMYASPSAQARRSTSPGACRPRTCPGTCWRSWPPPACRWHAGACWRAGRNPPARRPAAACWEGAGRPPPSSAAVAAGSAPGRAGGGGLHDARRTVVAVAAVTRRPVG